MILAFVFLVAVFLVRREIAYFVDKRFPHYGKWIVLSVLTLYAVTLWITWLTW